jgi:hypothetical protein
MKNNLWSNFKKAVLWEVTSFKWTMNYLGNRFKELKCQNEPQE